MAYLKFYRPYHSAYRDENTHEAFNQLMQHFNDYSNCGCNGGSIPASNVSETEKAYIIEMALPGIDKKNIHIRHEKGYLTIRVEKSNEVEKNETYTRQEFDYSGTSRTYKIGDQVDAENITAKYENGLLILQLPKKEAFVNKPVQSIAVE